MTVRKGIGFLGVTARLLMLIAATGLCLGYLAMFVSPARAWFLTVFSISFVPFALLNFILLLWAALRRSLSAIIPFLALLPCFFLAGRYIQGDKKDLPSPDGSIKIISYNVGQFRSCEDSLGFRSARACGNALCQYLQSRDADIICLQEFYAESADEITSILSKYFPGYTVKYYVNVIKRGVYGNVTLSRHPILDKGKLSFEKSANMALYTDVEAKGQIFRVYNCHFQAGLRIYDVSDPFVPKEIAYFMPPDPEVTWFDIEEGTLFPGPHVGHAEDCIVDDRGYIYVDTYQDGLYIVRCTV